MPNKLRLTIHFQKPSSETLANDDKKQAADLALWNIDALVFLITSLNSHGLEQVSEQVNEDAPENHLETVRNLINEFSGVVRINLEELDNERIKLKKKTAKQEAKNGAQEK